MRIGLLLGLALAASIGSAAKAHDKLVLATPVTHSDWMLRAGAEWGPAGVRKMLDTCKASGWTRIYWRALDGGRSLYKSKLLNPQGPWDADSYWNPATPQDLKRVESFGVTAAIRDQIRPKLDALDYSQFDTLAEAVKYGHQIGLEVHAWVSINEDDHGWGISSRFAKAHPEYRWVKRDGTAYRSQMSFAYPAVMKYKLAIVEELLTNYEIDGVFLDWMRTGDIRDNPQTDSKGIANHGFEQPLIDGFQTKHGVDPRTLPNDDEKWLRYRAEPHSQFMRSVRKLVTAKRPKAAVSVLVVHPWARRGAADKLDGNLRGLLLEVAGWANEGLIDAAVAGGYYLNGGTPEQATKALQAETGHKVPVWLFAWVPTTVAEVDRDVALAMKLEAQQMLFWEADYIDDGRAKDELQRAMRQYSAQ